MFDLKNINFVHLKRPDVKPKNPEKIGLAFEMIIGQNMSIQDVAKNLNVNEQGLNRWLSKYWFYQKLNDPVIIKLNSKV